VIKLLLFVSVLISKGSIEFYVYPFTVYSGDGVFTTHYFYTLNVTQIPIESKREYEEGEFYIEVLFKNLHTGRRVEDRWTKKFKLSGHTELTKIYDVFSVNLDKGEYESFIRFSTRAKLGEVKFRQSFELKYPFISDILIVPNISKEGKYFFKIQNISFNIRMPLEFIYPDTVVYYYYELYGFEGDEKIIYEIVKEGNILYSQEEKVSTIEKGFTSGRIPICRFGSGEMEFRVKIIKNGEVHYEKSESFAYYSEKVIRERSIREFYENYLFFIDYFAKSDEISAFRSIKDFEGKKLFVQKFWKEYDPDPSTQVNEFIYELIDRIKFADQNFSLGLKRKGRFTDRGRIYIKYGKPAEVESSYGG